MHSDGTFLLPKLFPGPPTSWSIQLHVLFLSLKNKENEKQKKNLTLLLPLTSRVLRLREFNGMHIFYHN